METTESNEWESAKIIRIKRQIDGDVRKSNAFPIMNQLQLIEWPYVEPLEIVSVAPFHKTALSGEELALLWKFQIETLSPALVQLA